MSDDFLDYSQMIRDALRAVPREALERIAAAGLPEPHHLYLTFRTDHPEVRVPSHLRDRYPEEMTVVLQHQYRDLEVDPEGFSVTLYFGGVPERIQVPFAALTAFLDPAVEFGLRFGAAGEEPEGAAGEDTTPSAEDAGKGARPPASVVSIDEFRKK